MRWGLRHVAIVGSASALIVVALACGKDLVESPEEDSGASDASTDLGKATDEAGRECTCLGPVPEGWTGPFVLDELTACAAPWGNDQPVFAELDAGTHQCSCTCAAPQAICVYRPSQSAGGCPSNCGLDYVVPTAESCVKRASGCGSAFVIYVDGGGGNCAPAETQRIDDAGFQRSAHQCTGPVAITTGVCPNSGSPCVLPHNGSSAAFCIEHTGESPCPPAYSVKHTFHRGIADTRACSQCACGNAGEPCAFVNHTADNCDAGTEVSNGNLGLCTPYGGGVVAHRILRKERACTKDGGVPIGKAEPTGLITVCCRPE